MKLSSIAEVESVYDCSINASISWQSVAFTEFQIFASAVERLIHAIGELDDDDYWVDLLKKIRKYRFDALAAPLSEEMLQERLGILVTYLHKNADRFKYSFPDGVAQYEHVLYAAQVLGKSTISQLLRVLADELHRYKEYDETAVLVCENRFRSDSEKSLESVGLQDVVVISPSNLREDIRYKNVFLLGPTRWFPDYVFSAPRAENIRILKYEWLPDKWKYEPAFIAPMQQYTSKLMATTIDEPFVNTSIDPEILRLPKFDFMRLQKQVETENRGHNEVDYVQARFFLLEEDWGVLLEADENSSVHVIDLEDEITPVKKVKTNEIERGMFILLRTKGGGDFIVPVADQIMGADGTNAREYQERWKKLLREEVTRLGYDEVIRLLQIYGSPRANYINLRNWVSERNIKTENKNDFFAIMKLGGLENEADLYWAEMELIDRAHRRAGHKIKTMLLDKVKNSDFQTLKRIGKIIFELDSENDISITAFQISDIAPDKIEALVSQLGYPIKQGD